MSAAAGMPCRCYGLPAHSQDDCSAARQLAALRAAVAAYDGSGALVLGPSEVHALLRLLDAEANQ